MARQHNSPKYRRQKRRGNVDLAFVELAGRRHYLGPYDSDASREAYHRLLAEWTASGTVTPVEPTEITIVELIARFWKHAHQYYRKPDGTPTNEINNYRQALRPLKEAYGSTRAADFGPLALKAVRQRMIDRGWCRGFINHQVNRIRHVFKWATENELVPPSTYHGLKAVSGLNRGRSEARETEPVKPVYDAVIDATIVHLTPTVRSMVELQRHTGMRPGEVCMIRGCDIDMSGPVWVYMPRTHKTEHHGRERKVYIGPRAQLIVRPYLTRNLQAHLFSPARAEEERRASRHAARKTPLSCGNMPGSNRVRQPARRAGPQYTATSYGRAIAYACNRAFPAPDELSEAEKQEWRRQHRWTPNQLRHNFATAIRRHHGLEAAQILLGHARADVTQIYAEVNLARATEIAIAIG